MTECIAGLEILASFTSLWYRYCILIFSIVASAWGACVSEGFSARILTSPFHFLVHDDLRGCDVEVHILLSNVESMECDTINSKNVC